MGKGAPGRPAEWRRYKTATTTTFFALGVELDKFSRAQEKKSPPSPLTWSHRRGEGGGGKRREGWGEKRKLWRGERKKKGRLLRPGEFFTAAPSPALFFPPKEETEA